MTVKVKYQIATYKGTIELSMSEDDYNEYSEEDILSMARAKLKKNSGGSLPFGYQSFSIVQ